MFKPIDPKFRTYDVIAVCSAVRATRDYSACPILADALQDAGFDDAVVLEDLRDPRTPLWRLEHLVARIFSHETEVAVCWIGNFADEMGHGGYPGDHGAMTYETLIEAARAFAETGDDGLGRGSMNWSNATADPIDMDTFWHYYGLVTATVPPADMYTFLSCDC